MPLSRREFGIQKHNHIGDFATRGELPSNLANRGHGSTIKQTHQGLWYWTHTAEIWASLTIGQTRLFVTYQVYPLQTKRGTLRAFVSTLIDSFFAGG